MGNKFGFLYLYSKGKMANFRKRIPTDFLHLFSKPEVKISIGKLTDEGNKSKSAELGENFQARVSVRSSGWLEHEISEWIEEKIKESRKS